jgi:hypothetical protein
MFLKKWHLHKNAIGIDINAEFVDSLIIGGKGCTTAIHLPNRLWRG